MTPSLPNSVYLLHTEDMLISTSPVEVLPVFEIDSTFPQCKINYSLPESSPDGADLNKISSTFDSDDYPTKVDFYTEDNN